jgi:ATP-dependent DNA helicase RecG
MNLDELHALVVQGESETLELKRSTGQRTDALKTVCGMLNGAQPGVVMFGVTDDGQVVGQDVAATTLEAIAAECRHIDPPAHIGVETVPIDERRSAIVLHVPGGTGLYSYDGRPYQRVGSTTSIMPSHIFLRRALELHHATTRWENHPVAEGVTLDDLNADDLRLSVDAAIAAGRLTSPVDRSTEALLRGFGLIADDRLLNAALVLYAGSERLFATYPQFSLRMARFRGMDKLADFIDNRQAWGNAFHLLRTAESFLQAHIPIAGRVVDGRRERIDRPLYTPRVLREALANALCHRDYASAGGSLSVAMFDDRLEISNPGHLPFGLTPEALLVPHDPKPWNPLVAQVFYRAAVVESWGTGTLNMIAWSRAAGTPDPVWQEAAGSVTVMLRAAEPESQPESELESVEDVNLTELQRELLEVLGRIGPASLSEIRAQVSPNIPERTVQNNLQSLRQSGLVELFGTRNAWKWRVR